MEVKATCQKGRTPWAQHCLVWAKPETWMPILTNWLQPRLRSDAISSLKPGCPRDLCWDDSEWLTLLQECLQSNLDAQVDELSIALAHATLRVFHGCRCDDVGTYFREGLHVHRRDRIAQRVREIVDLSSDLAWMKDDLDARIRKNENKLDEGRLYVAADDKIMLRDATHYLIYGSEAITAILGPLPFLKTLGIPTILDINLPLAICLPKARKDLALHLMGEWTRITCNGHEWSAPIDFTITLKRDILPAQLVGHRHPSEIPDPFDSYRIYKPPRTTCPYCV